MKRASLLAIIMLALIGCAGERIAAAPTSDPLRWPYLQKTTPTEVTVVWTTTASGTSTVQYSVDLSYSAVVTATSRLANVSAPAPYDTYMVHSAHIAGLLPDTAYHYRIFTGGTNLLPAEDLTFRTAPDPSANRAFTFLVVGDSGTGDPAQTDLRDRMLEQPADLILHAGDIAYSSGTYAQYETEVFAIYQALFARLPFFPTPGNHDYRTNHAAPYLDLFELPENAWRAGDKERYYSFDWGNVHFVALDTEDSLSQVSDVATDDMADWLAADLAATDRFWKIAYLHKPPYSSGGHGGNSTVLQKLVPILEQYGVNMAFSGHDHDYERTYPILGNQVSSVEAGGVIYVVTGGGGASLYPVLAGWWTAFVQSAYEFARVDVDGCQLRLRAIGRTGTVLDDTTVNRCVVPTPTVCAIPQDVDGSGQVDVADIMQVVAYWNVPAGVPQYDFDSDGDVDVMDVMWVAVAWGQSCTSAARTGISPAG